MNPYISAPKNLLYFSLLCSPVILIIVLLLFFDTYTVIGNTVLSRREDIFLLHKSGHDVLRFLFCL